MGNANRLRAWVLRFFTCSWSPAANFFRPGGLQGPAHQARRFCRCCLRETSHIPAASLAPPLPETLSLTRSCTRLGRWGLSESARTWLGSWKQHAQNRRARGAGTRPVSWRRHAQNRLARGAGTLPVSWRWHAQNRLAQGAGMLPVSWRRHAQNRRARGAGSSRTHALSSLALLHGSEGPDCSIAITCRKDQDCCLLHTVKNSILFL